MFLPFTWFYIAVLVCFILSKAIGYALVSSVIFFSCRRGIASIKKIPALLIANLRK